MPTKETDGVGAKFYMRAMFSCQDDWVECRATSEHEARTQYEAWYQRFDYAELWRDGVLLEKSYVEDGHSAFPEGCGDPSPPIRPAAGPWIPVAERKPKPWTLVLVYLTASSDDAAGVELSMWDSERELWLFTHENRFDERPVVAWAAISPPKGTEA